jgi:hypothetical protein
MGGGKEHCGEHCIKFMPVGNTLAGNVYAGTVNAGKDPRTNKMSADKMSVDKMAAGKKMQCLNQLKSKAN